MGHTWCTDPWEKEDDVSSFSREGITCPQKNPVCFIHLARETIILHDFVRQRRPSVIKFEFLESLSVTVSLYHTSLLANVATAQ